MSQPTVSKRNAVLVEREKSAIKFLDDFLDQYNESNEFAESQLAVSLKLIAEHVQNSSPPEIRAYIGTEVEKFIKSRSHLWKLVRHDRLINNFVKKVDSELRQFFQLIISKCNHPPGMKLMTLLKKCYGSSALPEICEIMEKMKALLELFPYLFTVIDSQDGPTIMLNRAEVIDDVIVFTRMKGSGRFIELRDDGNYGLVLEEQTKEIAFVLNTGGLNAKQLIQLKSENRKFDFEAIVNRNFADTKHPYYYWRISRLISVADQQKLKPIDESNTRSLGMNGHVQSIGSKESANSAFNVTEIPEPTSDIFVGVKSTGIGVHGRWSRIRHAMKIPIMPSRYMAMKMANTNNEKERFRRVLMKYQSNGVSSGADFKTDIVKKGSNEMSVNAAIGDSRPDSSQTYFSGRQSITNEEATSAIPKTVQMRDIGSRTVFANGAEIIV